MSSAALAAWSAVVVVGIGGCHRWVYLPWLDRRRTRAAEEAQERLFLHGAPGVEGLSDEVLPAYRRLFRVEEIVTGVAAKQITMEGTLAHVSTNVDQLLGIAQNGGHA